MDTYMTTLQYVGSIGGIGGILALIIFVVYRNTIKQLREDRKYMEDRLTKVIKDYNDSCRDNQAALVKHTEVLTELITWLKTKNGKSGKGK